VNAVASAFLLTFAGLFPIVNPLEAAPFFLGLTANLPAAERPVLARKAAINGFALLLGSMALGPWLLEFFGIELPVVRIAGGLVVAALGWKLLTQEQWSDHAGSTGLQGGPGKKVGSFYPLTMPLTVGPGSMSVAITIGSRKPAGLPGLSQLAEHAIGAVDEAVQRGAPFSGALRAILVEPGLCPRGIVVAEFNVVNSENKVGPKKIGMKSQETFASGNRVLIPSQHQVGIAFLQ